MRIPFALSSHERERGNTPPLRLVNMFVESTPTNQARVDLISRRGISPLLTVGGGPVSASIAVDGLFNGDRFTVSGGVLYRGTNPVGTIDGTGPVSMANSDTELLVTAGSTLYSYNGTNLIGVTVPYAEGTTAVCHVDGYFIALRGNTGEWYFSDVLDGRTFDSLNFATAESEADRLVDVLVLDGVLVLIGANTIEFWAKSGDAELPYTPIQQRVLLQGCAGTGCAVQEDNTFFWIGADKIVYRFDTVPKAIADDAVVEAAANSDTLRLYKLIDERHKFIVLRTDTKTHAFDLTTGEWTEFQSFGRDNFRVGPDMGDDEDGIVWQWDGFDDNGAEITRIFTAGAELEEPAIVNNLRLNCEVGTSSYLSGNWTNPTLEMRSSRDYGNTWSAWEGVRLGEQGDYDTRVVWHALGMFNFPGLVFQFRISDPVSFRATSVGVNEVFGGI